MIPSQYVLALTNLQSLALADPADEASRLTSLHPLTNLTSLSLKSLMYLTQQGISMLTNLKHIQTDNPHFFQTGKGSGYMVLTMDKEPCMMVTSVKFL